MRIEKDKVHDVIRVLSIMRSDFASRTGHVDVSRLRIDAVKAVADFGLRDGRFHGAVSARNSIGDAFARRLKPDIDGMNAFDELARQWLLNSATKLKDILLKNTNDPVRREQVVEFFADNSKPRSASGLAAKETRDTARFKPIWLPADDGDEGRANYSPLDGDHREIVERQIRARRGQQAFRNGLRKRYGDYCLVTQCRILDVLEAAHIKPYQGRNDNQLGNGLLLRADIHTLFDLDLLGIDPDGLCVQLHPDLLNDEEYAKLAGKELVCPCGQHPSSEALRLRYERFERRVRRPALG